MRKCWLRNSFDQKYIDLWREKSKDPNGVNENGVPNYIAYPNTNWLKELYSGGMIHEHNLSVSGGSNKIRFLLSARYQDNEGIVDNTANKTYSVRANIEANPTQWLTLGTRTYASQMDREVGDFSNANTFLRQSTAGTYPEWNGSFGYPNVRTNVQQPITHYINWHGMMASNATTVSTRHYLVRSSSLKI